MKKKGKEGLDLGLAESQRRKRKSLDKREEWVERKKFLRFLSFLGENLEKRGEIYRGCVLFPWLL